MGRCFFGSTVGLWLRTSALDRGFVYGRAFGAAAGPGGAASPCETALSGRWRMPSACLAVPACAPSCHPVASWLISDTPGTAASLVLRPCRFATRSGKARMAALPSWRCWPWAGASVASSRPRCRRRLGAARLPPSGQRRRRAQQRRQRRRSQTPGSASGSPQPRPMACWVRAGCHVCCVDAGMSWPPASCNLCRGLLPLYSSAAGQRSQPAMCCAGAATGLHYGPPLLEPCRGRAL